jgi:hypothetical protein
MSLKVRMFGIACLAVFAASAVVIVNAPATAGGHFTSNRASTTIEGIEQSVDTLEFHLGSDEGIICEKSTYHGVFNGPTVTAFKLTPKYEQCKTTKSGGGDVTIETHDCTYEFTVRPLPETNHNTIHIKCPTGKKLTIKDTSTGCTFEIGPQTVSGVVYKQIQYLGTESITAEFTVKNIQYTEHKGLCLFSPTTRNDGELTGSLILKAWNNAVPGEGADITAT